MDAFPTNASIMNSVHTKMPPMFNNEEQQLKKQINVQVNHQEKSGESLIRIPVQHLPAANSQQQQQSNQQELNLRSPSILSTALSSPTQTGNDFN